jgi:regulator of extracellular matrix RemA (YlzA/DUF370 family)
VKKIMLISIGNKHFIESTYVVEILKAADTQAVGVKHMAIESGKLINASGARRIRSVIKLKSKHIVLSALKAETLKSRLANASLPAVPGDSDASKPKPQKRYVPELKAPEFHEQRLEPDRRRFSYTHHIPERRSGADRRNKDRRR